MNELIDFITTVDGLTMNVRSAARAFWNIDVTTVNGLISYLAGDIDYYHRPKGIGEENYKLLVDFAKRFSDEHQPTFVGLTCTTGISFTGMLTKQDYAEFSGVIEALQIWLKTHEVR